jgi:coenzyme Q-binding protein COQ10
MSFSMTSTVAPYRLGPMPSGRRMTTIDERVVAAPLEAIFDLAWRVEEWPRHLVHYRWVRFRDRRSDGGGLVEMSANRPFGFFDWPTYWMSEMAVERVDESGAVAPRVRFRHVAGITRGMEVEWSFRRDGSSGGTLVRIVHVWDGPSWPVVGPLVAVRVIGPVFVHGIASRTLAGLCGVAEAGDQQRSGA